ncbi:MAG: penicillin-binding protein 2 [Herpetosiphonaceae bacterium]|nr:penicillin-binding protein 2 [Herpetosiphonaceae bacterium]
MLRFFKVLAGLAAVGLIVYGMSPLANETRWLQCLWAATFLGGFAIWPIRSQRATGISNGTQNLALVLLIGFTMLTVQLLRLQVVKASEIYNRSVIDEAGNPTSNPRPGLEGGKIKRGSIFDAQGAVIAENIVTENNFSHRTYPIGEQYDINAFGHILGYVSTRYGIAGGIEETFDPYLSGRKGNSWANLQNEIFHRPQIGNNLQLTINADLQNRAYQALQGRVGSVVVLDVKTGAIRAMVSNPSFDPDQLTFDTNTDDIAAENARIDEYWNGLLGNEGRPLIYRATQGLYPPGSTFKTVTAVGVLNNPEVGKPEDISCPNRFVADQQVSEEFAVRNAIEDEERYIVDKYGSNYGLDGVYAFSCNTAFAQYGLRLQSDNRNLLAEQAERFHVYTPANLPEDGDLTDLPSAPSSLYSGDDGATWWKQPAAHADTAFGQGRLQVTPLVMAQIAQAIGNNGTMMKPYLVERITTPEGGELFRAKPRKIGEPLTPQVAQRMYQSMQAVIDRGWSGATAAGVPGVTVGGKSGTAENPHGDPHAWFISIAPLEDPRYAVAVMVENGGEGTSVGGSLAGLVMAAALEIAP